MNALEELEAWSRKHYRYTIINGGSMQPGDGVYVELEAGDRKVGVGECDLEGKLYGTLEEVIREAIRIWHADRSPKNYSVLGFWHDGNESSLRAGSDLKFSYRYKDGDNGSFEVRLTATHEESALELVRAVVVNCPDSLCVWEMTQGWTH
jgi:hypothetical protein